MWQVSNGLGNSESKSNLSKICSGQSGLTKRKNLNPIIFEPFLTVFSRNTIKSDLLKKYFSIEKIFYVKILT